MTHQEPDRDGEIIEGLKIALAAEALVVCAILCAISLNVNALVDASAIITEWMK